jgi:cellulose synthase (UDP-forming)
MNRALNTQTTSDIQLNLQSPEVETRHDPPTASVPVPLLSVVIPTYNEERRLPPTLERITSYLSRQSYVWEVIVSDDGSSDNTLRIAEEFKQQWPQVRTLTVARNQGKGAAVRRGMLAALGNYVVFSDADGATPISEVEKILPLLRASCDVVLGSRAMPDSSIVTKQPLSRRIMGKAFRRIVHRLALTEVHDTQCGFKAFRAPAARHIFAQLRTERFAFDVETVLLTEALGYEMAEVGVVWADQPGGTVSPIRDAWYMFRDIYGLRHGLQQRLDNELQSIPGDDDPCLGIVTLRNESSDSELPVDQLVDDIRRSDNTVVFERSPGVAVLGTFALAGWETRQATTELAAKSTEILAASGESSLVTGEAQLLPLATPINWVRARSTTSAVVPARGKNLLTTLHLEEEAREADIRSFERRREAWSRRRQTLRPAILLNLVFLAWWLVWLYDYSHAATWWLYTSLVVAETFSITQVLGYWFTVWHDREPERKRARVPGRVDVFIATYNESVELVEQTVRGAMAIRYPHRTYVLDDGHRPEMGEMARRLGAQWITRPNNTGAKAGNINHALTLTDGDYFAVFDADHVPHPNFLSRLMPFMEDPRMALVQAPQYYSNRDRTYVAGAAMDQQEIFFGPICNGKDGLGSVFCCGTNMVLRRAAIDEIGGFRENSVTEDAATTLDIHERGWKSKYVSERLADGMGPEDLGAYITQQHRWARGSLEMLFKFGVLFRHMPWRLRLQYAWSAMFYLTGVSTLVYLALPSLFLLFGIQAVSAQSGDFIAHFLPYIFLTIFILARSAEGNLHFRAIQFSYGLFPVFLSALISLILGKKVGFHVTPKERNDGTFYRLIIPQLVTVAILLASIVIGFLHFSGARTITNASWALFDVFLLAGIIRGAGRQRVADDVQTARNGATGETVSQFSA